MRLRPRLLRARLLSLRRSLHQGGLHRRPRSIAARLQSFRRRIWLTRPPLRSAVVGGACSYSSTWREMPPPDAQRFFFNAARAGRETCTPGIQSHPACCVRQMRLISSLTAARPIDHRRNSWPTVPPPAAPRRPLMPPAPAASPVRQSGSPLDNWTASRERWRHHIMHSSVASLSTCFTKGRLAAWASGMMLTGHRGGQRMFHDGQATCKGRLHARASGTMLNGHRGGQRMSHDGQASCKGQRHDAHRAQGWSARRAPAARRRRGWG